MISKNPNNSLIVKAIFGIFACVLGLVLVANMITTVSADEVVVKQDAIGGALHVWDTPGVHWQNFGTIIRYKRSAQFWFSAKEDEGKKTDDSIKVRFSDGGHGNISGSLRYSLPTDPNKMIELHRTYHSMESINHELVQQVVNKGVYMSGPLMSSRESYAEKRADLINYIADQITYGVYKTEHEQIKINDPITGQEKTIDVVRPKIQEGSPNGIAREEESPVQRFGMNANNITINGIEYDPVVEAQIKQQQESIMSVQSSIVNAKKAEQDTITVEQQGKASAAKAKWDQEVEKAKAVTAAEQEKAVAITQAEKNKEVAALSLETAKLNAQQTMATAKAESDAKKLALTADNQLEMRLDVYRQIAVAQAAAIGAQRQVPDIQMGGSSSNSSSTQALMDVLALKTARDLGVSAKP